VGNSILSQKINHLLDCDEFKKLEQLLFQKLNEFQSLPEPDYFLLSTIAGGLISLGNESNDIKSIEKGTKIFTDYEKEISGKAITKCSFNYNLGNGYNSKFKALAREIPNFYPTIENVRDTLFLAKQRYLRAFKEVDLQNINAFTIKLLTNLGNSLGSSGREVESQQWYNLVLNHEPSFPQALVSKANSLRRIVMVTHVKGSISMSAEIYRLYDRVDLRRIPSIAVKNDIVQFMSFIKKKLTEEGFTIDRLHDEIELSRKEYKLHSNIVKYYMDNSLGLSEHGLYCKCNGAVSDELSIGQKGFETYNVKIMELELLNNRIKSEFAMARRLFYEHVHKTKSDTVFYQRVVPGIEHGLNSENVRISFRLCFGILDKIARGICHLFDLQKGDKEDLYFESFWKNSRAPERWNQLKSIKNIHLTALYSIASDLNRVQGEFHFYKKWRNDLEHEIFNISNSNFDKDYMKSDWTENHFSKEEFVNKTLHLLQLTRSAIFSFVFCARKEMIYKV